MRPLYLITVLFNSEQVLPAFIASLQAQTYREWILIAIDNASKDNGAEYLRGLGDDRIRVIVNDQNLGVAAANNQGLIAALSDSAEWMVILNNDITFSSDCFSQLFSIAHENKAKLLAPLIVYAGDTNRVWYASGDLVRWPLCTVRHVDMDQPLRGKHHQAGWCSYASTCFLFIHRDVIHNVGLMWEPFFVYTDDVDYMYRINKCGYRIYYAASCVVQHHVGFSSGGPLSNFSIHYGSRNAILLMRRHLPEGLWRIQYLLFRLKGWLAWKSGKKTQESYLLRVKGIKAGLEASYR